MDIDEFITREFVDNKKTIAQISRDSCLCERYISKKLEELNLRKRKRKEIKDNDIKGRKENFLIKAAKIHNNKYIYDKVEYINLETKIIITCPKHGDFIQSPKCHIKGHGCSSCIKISVGEELIKKYLDDKNIDYLRQYTTNKCVNKRPLPFDFAIWINNQICFIEYQGLHHYQELPSWKKYPLEYRMKNDLIKKNYCLKNNIPLLVISYWDRKDMISILEIFIDKCKN